MQKTYWTIVIAGIALCLLLSVAGCDIDTEEYERSVRLSGPLAAGSSFAAETHNGAITLNGQDASGCDLTATITGRAPTEDVAKELAEKTKVALNAHDDKLVVEIDRAKLKRNQSVSVSLDANVPSEIDLLVSTHNGAVTIENIQGKADAATHNGSIRIGYAAGD